MGERVEIVTWPHHMRNVYKVTSGAFAFEVKGDNEAVIWLSSSFFKRRNGYKIKLSSYEGCIMMSSEPSINNSPYVNFTDVLSNVEFKRYWLTFYGDRISLGKHGEINPFLSMDVPTRVIKYISFDIEDSRTPVYWKFDLPPMLEQIILRPITSGSMQWVSAENQLPPNALVAGNENEFLFIIRSHHRGSLTPGKFVPSLGLGFIPWGGDSNEKSEFEVLCGYDCKWMATHDELVPNNAVAAGYSEVNREILYVGRAEYEGHLIPGKVQPSHKVCYIPYGAKEIAVKNYQVLVHVDSNHCSLKKISLNEFRNDEYQINLFDNMLMEDNYFPESDSDVHDEDDDGDEYM